MSSGQPVERRGGDRRVNADRRSGGDRRSGFDRRATDRRSNLVYLVADGGQRLATPNQVAAATPRRPLLNDQEFSLLEAVARVFDAATDPQLWPKALAGVSATLAADTCALAEHDPSGATGRLLYWVGLDAAAAEGYALAHAPAGGEAAAEATVAAGSVSIEAADTAGQESQKGRLPRGWREAHGIGPALRGIVDVADGMVAQVLIMRAAGEDAFTDDDAALLRRLLPALQRSLRAGRALRKAEFFHQVAFDALDAVPLGIAFVDAAGEITAANRIARQIIESENVRAYQETIRRSEATARTPRLRRAVADAMSDLQDAGGEVLSAFAVPRRAGLRPLTCLLAPVGASADGVDVADRPQAMLFIGDPEKPMEIDQRRLRQLYGLSRAEARVVALLAQGYKLDATAENLGLVYETVRKHLKQVFDKTGCDRQAELVRLLVTGPAALAI
jgi:DNA-binding CsgD family transcriptional regulator/PAS domain-containing protein